MKAQANVALPYRLIFRGHDKDGNYKRGTRIVRATSPEAAAGYLAENGEKIAKEMPFKVEFTNIFAPLV